MSLASVKEFFHNLGRENDILEFPVSSATVALAAEAVGPEPARIAKTLSFMTPDGPILVVAAGDTKVDNRKFKDTFHCKATFLTPEQVLEYTGHPIGGVCPFALATPVPVFLDESLRRFETVFPAAGSANSAIELSPAELEGVCEGSRWVTVCKIPE